jgi:hypothetical protein
MPALTNARHERFAKERALGNTLTDAWESAAGRRSTAYAFRVGKRPEVAARIGELQGRTRG